MQITWEGFLLTLSMKFKVSKDLKYSPENILRTCNYFPIFDRRTQKGSFVRKLTQNRYPRFHMYVKEKGDELIFDLHLDQSKTVYSGAKAHNADYDSPEVKTELVRVFAKVKEAVTPAEKEQVIPKENKVAEEETQPNWLAKLFKKS